MIHFLRFHPHAQVIGAVHTDLIITLYGVPALPGASESQDDWAQNTKTYINDFFDSAGDLGVFDVSTLIYAVREQSNSVQTTSSDNIFAHRMLQEGGEDSVTVTYNQESNYVTTDPSQFGHAYVVEEPFMSEESQSAYVAYLHSISNAETNYTNVTRISAVTIPSASPSGAPSFPPSKASSTSPSERPSQVPSLILSEGPSFSGMPSLTPSESPSISPTAEPTSIPDGAVFFDGFEVATFPSDIEWETGGDLPWELTTDKASTGIYSIRSANLTNDDLARNVSTVTLAVNETWGSGILYFSVLAQVNSPFDNFTCYVDGVESKSLSNVTEFVQEEIELSPGANEVEFRYTQNPLGIGVFPPGEPGAVYLDDVYFVPLTSRPSNSPSSSSSPTDSDVPSLQPSTSSVPTDTVSEGVSVRMRCCIVLRS